MPRKDITDLSVTAAAAMKVAALAAKVANRSSDQSTVTEASARDQVAPFMTLSPPSVGLVGRPRRGSSRRPVLAGH